MATTTIYKSDALVMSAWSKKLMAEISRATPIAPLIGKGKNAIIQLKEELQKGAGDKITFGLRRPLSGHGVSEHVQLEGQEEALSTLHDTLTIGELVHAVRVRHEGTIDQQRVPFDLRQEALEGLADWYAERLAIVAFVHLCGFSGSEMTLPNGQTVTLDERYQGFNSVKAPSAASHILACSGQDETKLEKKHSFSLDLIDKAVERAKIGVNAMRPIRIGNEKLYVMYLHPTQVTALRTNAQPGQWLDIQKAAYTGSRKDNPIFDGSLGMYNGVILRESPYISPGFGLAEIPHVRRAVLLGAQAGVIAFGKNNGPTRYRLVEQVFDYQRELGIAAKTLFGFKKTSYSNGKKESYHDFGSIVVSTYAERA